MEDFSRVRGCWTCRARRKGCDGRSPACATCERLSIVCSGFAITKPVWMDGGSRQRQFLESVKVSIRHGQRCRSATKSSSFNIGAHMTSSSRDILQPGGSGHNFKGNAQPCLHISELDTTTTTENGNSILDFASPNFDWSGLSFVDVQPSVEDFTQVPIDISDNILLGRPMESQETSSKQWLVVMRYFDHTFHRVFPHHCWAMDRGERGWLLSLINQSDSLRLTIMSLVFYGDASYGAGPIGSIDESHAPRDDLRLDRWQRCYQEASEIHAKNMSDIYENDNLPSELKRKLAHEALACVVHFVSLEISGASIGDSAKLLDQGLSLITTLSHKEVKGLSTEAVNNDLQRSWSMDKIAEKRAVALLKSKIVRWNVIFATSAKIPLDLSTYLLTSPTSVDQTLDLMYLCGCSKKVLALINEITELNSWKEQAEANGALSILDLGSRASDIQKALQNILEPFYANDWGDSGNLMIPCRPGTRVEEVEGPCGWHTQVAERSNVAFAISAEIYLCVVVSGWNPKLPKIQDSVKKSIRHLSDSSVVTQMDTINLAWPIYITGCMAGITDAQNATVTRVVLCNARKFEDGLISSSSYHEI